jgi:hypothetical protein
MPEDLPLAEPITQVRKRLKAQKQKMLPPTEPSSG